MKSRYCFMKCVYWIMTQNIFHSEVCSPKLENTYPRERIEWCYYSQTIWTPAAYEMAASGDGERLWSSDTGNDKQHIERETPLQGVQCSKFLRHASTDDTPQAPAEIHVWPRDIGHPPQCLQPVTPSLEGTGPIVSTQIPTGMTPFAIFSSSNFLCNCTY